MTSTVRRVLNLVVEYRVVECKTQSDGVCGLHLLLSNLEGFFIGLLRALGHLCGNGTREVLVGTVVMPSSGKCIKTISARNCMSVF